MPVAAIELISFQKLLDSHNAERSECLSRLTEALESKDQIRHNAERSECLSRQCRNLGIDIQRVTGQFSGTSFLLSGLGWVCGDILVGRGFFEWEENDSTIVRSFRPYEYKMPGRLESPKRRRKG
ncbi:MAG: hypothetical protein KDM64_06695, partial [Verrucomicrobiae bacterium]|nr:hypothetical protein [Verrucomicrobiae bacterium]